MPPDIEYLLPEDDPDYRPPPPHPALTPPSAPDEGKPGWKRLRPLPPEAPPLDPNGTEQPLAPKERPPLERPLEPLRPGPPRPPVQQRPMPKMPPATPQARKHDPFTQQVNRGAGRGFIDPDQADANEHIIWLIFGLIGLVISVGTSFYGVNAVWRKVYDIPLGMPTPVGVTATGIIMGVVFVFGQIGLLPGIYRDIKKWKQDGASIFHLFDYVRWENLVLYLFCVTPDTVSTGLANYYGWAHPFLVKSLDSSRLVFWASFALCGSIAFAASMLPIMAVIKRDRPSP